MIISGHRLPESFVVGLDSKSLQRDVGSWSLKRDVDSYGNKLETELGEVWSTENEILKNTQQLPSQFVADGYYGSGSESVNEPGYVEDILEFSDIVTFAISGDGAPFCFDYRDNADSPSVIWWDDVYWRKVSDNYEDFIALFDI